MSATATVTQAEFSLVKQDLSDIKGVLGRMAEALTQLALLEQGQKGVVQSVNAVLDRLSGLENRQHQAELARAAAGDLQGDVKVLQGALREMTLEREKDKARIDGMLSTMRWFWAGAIAVAGAGAWIIRTLVSLA